MGTYQHDAWEANELMLDAQEEFERGNAPEGWEPDWVEFVAVQSEAEWEAMLNDPAYIAWCDRRAEEIEIEAQWAA